MNCDIKKYKNYKTAAEAVGEVGAFDIGDSFESIPDQDNSWHKQIKEYVDTLISDNILAKKVTNKIYYESFMTDFQNWFTNNGKNPVHRYGNPNGTPKLENGFVRNWIGQRYSIMPKELSQDVYLSNRAARLYPSNNIVSDNVTIDTDTFLAAVNSNYQNTFQGKVLNEIKPYMKAKNIVVSDEGFVGDRENAIGYYNPNTSTLYIRNGLSDNELLLVAAHEASHDVIKVGLANSSIFDDQIKDIMVKAKTLSSKYRQYFYELQNGKEVLSTEEFVTGVMSDGQFRSDLQKLNKQNIFTKILNGIKNLFGLSNDYVRNTLKIADKVMKLQQDILNDRKTKSYEAYVGTTTVRERNLSNLLRDDLMISNDRKNAGQNFDDRLNEDRVNRYMAILRKNEYIIRVAGKTVDLFAYMSDESELAKQVREKIMPLDKELQNKKIDSIIKFFSNDPITGGQGNMDNFNDFFTAKDEEGNKYTIVHENVIESLRSIFKYKTGTIVMRYKEVQAFLESIKSPYAKSFDVTLLDSNVDPVVVIHSMKDNFDISIYDFVSRFDLNISGIGLKNNGLFRNYIKDVAGIDEISAKTLDINLKNVYRDYKQLRLFVLASKVLKENEKGNVQFRDIATLNLITNERKQFVDYHTVDIPRMANNMKGIKSIKSFMDSLPSNFKDIFNSEFVTDFKNYQADYVIILRNILYNAQNLKAKEGKKTPQLDRQISSIDDFIENNNEWRLLLSVVEERLQFYRNNPNAEKNNKVEIGYLKHIYEDLKAFRSNKGYSGKSKTTIFNMMNTMSAQPSVIVRETVQIFKDVNAEVIGVYQKDEKQINDKVREIKAYYKANPDLNINVNFAKERTVNTSGEWYKRLFVYKTFKASEEANGLKEINTGMLHVDRSQPGSEKLDDKEIEFANWFADLFDKHVKNMYRRVELGRYSNLVWDDKMSKKILDMDKVEKNVEIQYSMNWKRGMSPLMYASASELLAQGQKLEAIQKFFYRNFDPTKELDEEVGITNDEKGLFEVKSFFGGQITGAVPNGFGGVQRMEMLSLDINDGIPELFKTEKGKNKRFYTVDGLSTDLETISKFFVMDDYWTQAMNDNILPVFEAANNRLDVLEQVSGNNQDNNRKMLLWYFAKNVNSENQLEDKSKEWMGLTRLSKIGYQATMFTGLAYSPTVAVVSMTANMTEAIKLAVANMVGNPYDLFLPKDLFSAMHDVTFGSGSMKASVLGDVFQIINRTKLDSLQHQRYKQGNKSLLTQHYANIMAWVTDYECRKVIMAAQMRHEGSWDAYSINEQKEPGYDVKKDRQYFNLDGTQTKEQKFLMDELRKDLLDDPRFRDEQLAADIKNPDNKLPVWGHSSRQQQKFEWIGNKFVVGTYNQTDVHPWDVFNIVKLFTQYKKYFISKLEHRLGKKLDTKGGTEGAEGGKYMTVEQEDGSLKRVYISPDLEGTYRTFFNYMHKNVKNLIKGKGFEKMTEQEKHNTAQTIGDMLFLAFGILIVFGISSLGGDDDEKKKALANFRLTRAFQNGLLTAIAVSPDEIMNMINQPIPLKKFIEKLYDAARGESSQKEILRLLPGTSMVKTVDEAIDLFDNDDEELTK